MKVIGWIAVFGSVFWSSFALGQTRGKLFIIGGGQRPQSLIQEMINTANFRTDDYTVVLLMATTVPEESLKGIKSQISEINPNQIVGFNFTREQADNSTNAIDSVQNARLIYVVGGDQNKFMDVVRGTKLYDAMHKAYQNGATIAGTSAGAAIMSEVMITGSQRIRTDTIFSDIRLQNVITESGMGFIKTAIIDQHFIKRSRYNRLLSVLADFPDKTLIGVDESTAIIVNGNKVRVAGESLVVVAKKPKGLKQNQNGMTTIRKVKLSLFGAGDQFKI